MQYSTLREEKKLWKQGYNIVACIDEAGRGPLAGPVVACAVVLKPDLGKTKSGLSNIRDSKKLSPKRREEIYRTIKKRLFESEDSSLGTESSGRTSGSERTWIQWGIGIVSEKAIDKINIYQATKLAMTKAVLDLQTKLQKNKHITKSRYSRKTLYPDFLILDGNMKLENVSIPQKAIVRGDERVFSCALASIIAKVTRDRIMMRYHKKYPQYRFDKHKGYGTMLHMKMLKKYGPCPIHRETFAPVKFEILSTKFETNSKSKNSKF